MRFGKKTTFRPHQNALQRNEIKIPIKMDGVDRSKRDRMRKKIILYKTFRALFLTFSSFFFFLSNIFRANFVF